MGNEVWQSRLDFSKSKDSSGSADFKVVSADADLGVSK